MPINQALQSALADFNKASERNDQADARQAQNESALLRAFGSISAWTSTAQREIERALLDNGHEIAFKEHRAKAEDRTSNPWVEVRVTPRGPKWPNAPKRPGAVLRLTALRDRCEIEVLREVGDVNEVRSVPHASVDETFVGDCLAGTLQLWAQATAT